MERKIIFSENAPKAIGPYSQAVKVSAGALYFLSGQVPLDPATGKLVEGDISAMTKRALENLKAVLSAEGLDFSNVVKTTIYLTDMSNFTKVNEVYSGYFKENPPARATVAVSALPLGAPVEIELIAAK
ncbi:MAG: RidA family protein [Myxococcota bacterium]